MESSDSSVVTNNRMGMEVDNPILDIWMSNDKENQNQLHPCSGTSAVMFSTESLSAIPENKMFSVDRKMVEEKIADLELGSLDSCNGGEKRLAMIDPLQSLNGTSRIARRLFVSPLQRAISGRKRSFDVNSNSHCDSERVSKRIMLTTVRTKAQGSNQYQHQHQQQQPQNPTSEEKLSDEDRIDFLCGKKRYVTVSTKLMVERECDIFFDTLNKVHGVDESKIYDSCPEVVAKIYAFLDTFKMVDRSLLHRFLGVHGNAFNSFMSGQNQEKCDNPTYLKAYVFFEKLRIYFGKPKSEARIFNETYYPYGFSIEKYPKKKLIVKTGKGGTSTTPYSFC